MLVTPSPPFLPPANTLGVIASLLAPLPSSPPTRPRGLPTTHTPPNLTHPLIHTHPPEEGINVRTLQVCSICSHQVNHNHLLLLLLGLAPPPECLVVRHLGPPSHCTIALVLLLGCANTQRHYDLSTAPQTLLNLLLLCTRP